MPTQETVARALADRLTAVGLDATARGAGVHWQVDVSRAPRTVRVHCFWYERAISALMLGMNPSNARTCGRRVRSPPYEGPEYLLILHDGATRVADGRTRHVEEAVACVRAWLARRSLEELVMETPFIDEKPRRMRALAERIDARLRSEIFAEPGCHLWIYGEGRACEIVPAEEPPACNFFFGQQRVAFAEALPDIPEAVSAWLREGVSVRALGARKGVELERHAEVLEADPARWHWLHVSDRIGDPDDVLAPLRDVIEGFAASPIVSSFYSYSSLDRFCFSASSHYPWVDDGLPIVSPTRDGACTVQNRGSSAQRVERGDVLKLVEATLKRAPVRPFFGSALHLELPRIAQGLALLGSWLRPHLRQHGPWFELAVDGRDGRQCRIDGPIVHFRSATERLAASWPVLEEEVRAIKRYCEEGATLSELAADPACRTLPT